MWPAPPPTALPRAKRRTPGGFTGGCGYHDMVKHARATTNGTPNDPVGLVAHEDGTAGRSESKHEDPGAAIAQGDSEQLQATAHDEQHTAKDGPKHQEIALAEEFASAYVPPPSEDGDIVLSARRGSKHGTPPPVPGFSGFLQQLAPRWTHAKPSQRALNSARSSLNSARSAKNSARSSRSATSLNTSSTSFAGSSTMSTSSKSPRITEAQYRRMLVQQENRKRTEEEMAYQRSRRSWQHLDNEQYMLEGAGLVAEGRQQRERVQAARRSASAARSEQGSTVKYDTEVIRQELQQQRFLALLRQKDRVEDTAHMRWRAKQNVAGVRQAKSRAGRDERIAARMLEMIRDDEREALQADKMERAQRVREDTSQSVLGASRALWEDDKREVGIMLRAHECNGREQREQERQTYLLGAQIFKQEVGEWRTSAKEVRTRLAEERKVKAQMAREQRERDAELREFEKEQARRARQEAHDSVYSARYVDEHLVADYCDHEKSIIEAAWEHEDARATAAVRATMVRRQRRRNMGRLVRQVTARDNPFLSSRNSRNQKDSQGPQKTILGDLVPSAATQHMAALPLDISAHAPSEPQQTPPEGGKPLPGPQSTPSENVTNPEEGTASKDGGSPTRTAAAELTA